MPRPTVWLLAVALLAAACAGSGSAGSRNAGEPLTAAGTVFPLVWMMTEIAPEADVTYLGSEGQDPHDLELTPRERALVDGADVVAYLGDLGFQPQVEAAVAGRDGITVDVREVLGDSAFKTFDRDHDHEEDGERGEAAGLDPHVWLDPTLMAEVAPALAEALARADAGGAAGYRDNARALSERLESLDAELDALLAGCRHDTAIVSHAAYAYLLEPRGLHQEGISGAGGHAEVSPQRLAELTRHIGDEGVPAVLAEPVEGRADAAAVAREAGVDLLDVDPLESAGDEASDAGYVELLLRQGEQFARALDCAGGRPS